MSTSPKEIELKLEVSPEDQEQLKRSRAFQGFTADRATTKILLSVYFDTVDQALRKAKTILRVRKVGRAWIQTVKLGTGLSGGLSNAIEVEHPVKGRSIDLSVIEDPQIRDRLAQIIGDNPLQECFETNIRRTTRLFTSHADGSEIEVAFDTGEIKLGDNSLPLAEIELELKSGSISALFEAAREILGATPFHFSPCNKAERGFRFAEGQIDARLTPRLADDAALAADETVERAFRNILRSCLTQITHNREVILAGNDPEGPHQFRIGLRRLRSAFRLFKPALHPGTFKPLDDMARSLAIETGNVRDLDVLTDEIINPLADDVPAGLSMASLLEHLNGVREQRRAALKERLAQPDINGFLFDLAAYTESRGWLDTDNFDQTAVLAQPILSYSRKALKKQWKKVSQYGSKIDDLAIPERHEMRKALKKLRYGIEFFGSLYPPKEIKPFLKRMKKLQDIFGYLNDVAMAEKLASLSAANSKAAGPVQLAIGFTIGWHDAQSRAMWPHAKGYWLETQKVPKFWR